MKLTDTLLDLLFPPKCPFCRRVLDAPGVCPECEKTLPWTDEAHGLRELGRPPLRRAAVVRGLRPGGRPPVQVPRRRLRRRTPGGADRPGGGGALLRGIRRGHLGPRQRPPSAEAGL